MLMRGCFIVTRSCLQYLKTALPTPADDATSLIEDPKLIIWNPVKRSGISWNFEKFLIGPDGKPFRRLVVRLLWGGGDVGTVTFDSRI